MIIEPMVFDLQNNSEIDENYENKINYSTWIKSNDTFKPIIDSQIEKKLDPGFYSVQTDSNGGLICKKITLDSDSLICFENSVFSDLNNEISKFWNLKNKFEDNNIIHKRGILLEGPAGNGKSSLITLLIKELIKNNGIAFIVKNAEHFYNTSLFLKTIFRKIEKDTPIITIIEDIDLIPDYIIPELLDFLDGKSSINHSVCIMTTNNSSNLSPALLRPSRVDKRYILNSPNEELRKTYFKSRNIKEDLIDKYVENTKGFSFAKLKELYISTILLENDFEESIKVLNEEIEGKNYLETDELQIQI